MPLQNRVTPYGTIIATPERGTFMGNRGVLHDEDGRIRRNSAVRRWIVCVLEFGGRKRTVMKPQSYTELFFLDEATAFAAGHRPCAECRHRRFLDYCAAWKLVKGGGSEERPCAYEIDAVLHAERVGVDRKKVLLEADIGELSDGVFVKLADQEEALLVYGGHLLAWSAGGYRRRVKRPASGACLLITPRPTVDVIRAGYEPEMHESAAALQ
ncbi:hypothetical protein BH10PLA2_BH10PLA2_25610 [soil metagenome]